MMSGGAYRKDIFRSIRHGRKRFIAIILITILGVTMFSGLKAACMDLRRSGDRFFDQQDLHDLAVYSTLGLTEEDVLALESLEGVEKACGVYTGQVRAGSAGLQIGADLQTLTEGMDVPFVEEGRMPVRDDEAAVTGKFLVDSGLSVGDTFTITSDTDTEEDMEDVYRIKRFTITAQVIDPQEVDNPYGSMNYRSMNAKVDKIFVRPGAVDSDYYTAVYLTAQGASGMFCFGEAYQQKIADLKSLIEDSIMDQRRQARYDQVLADAQKKIDDGQQEADRELAQAEKDLDQGRKELEDQLSQAKKELDQAALDLQEGRSQLESGKKQLADQEKAAESQMEQAQQQLTDRKKQISQSEASLDGQIAYASSAYGSAWPQSQWDSLVQAAAAAYQPYIAQAMNEGASSADSGDSSVPGQISGQTAAFAAALSAGLGGADVSGYIKDLTSMAIGKGKLLAWDAALDAAQQQLSAQQQTAREQISQGKETLDGKEKELNSSRQQLQSGIEQLGEGADQLLAGEKALQEKQDLALQSFADARAQIRENEDRLLQGQSDYESGLTEYEQGKAEGQSSLESAQAEYEKGKKQAQESLQEARQKLKDIKMADWYIQDRGALSGYSNISSDADSIEVIGTAFPVIFFIVAVLISLTTITRLVEEDRGLIGTYKALGFTDGEIRRKYLVYAGLSSAIGALAGTAMAFVAFPKFIFIVFRIMYVLPDYALWFEPVFGISGPFLFVGGILLATAAACRSELAHTPAQLMRPKAPRAGMRVLLERIRPVWKRLSFLNKVTARNLFRYKKRLFMTIAGIAGCMSLLLFGFSIRDSVHDLAPRQYGQTFRYDMMAAVSSGDNDRLLQQMKDDPQIGSYLNICLTQGILRTDQGDKLSLQVMIVPDDSDLEKYIHLQDLKGRTIELGEGDVFVTRNAATVLDFAAGQKLSLQLADLQLAQPEITAVVENYLGNYIYMRESTFRQYYDDCQRNAVLADFSDQVKSQTQWCGQFSEKDWVLSCSSIEQFKNGFADSFALINMVVYIIIFMSACLAFVVLFTLSTTNISERNREIATIKVLGFYDPEVHLYINKETMILTVMGILAGIPLGWMFSRSLSVILKLPSIYLASSLHLPAYFLAAALSFGFSLIVNVIMNRTLDRIDPVEALKSVE